MKKNIGYLIIMIIILACSTLRVSAIFDAAADGEIVRLNSIISGSPESVNAKLDKTEETPLHLAVKNNQKEAVLLLISKDADINSRDVAGRTPLMAAVADENIDIAVLLIKKGAYIEAVNNKGWRALHFAAAMGNTDLARTLVEEGADVEAKTENDETPLDLAKKNEKKEVADYLSGQIFKKEKMPVLKPIIFFAFVIILFIAFLIYMRNRSVKELELQLQNLQGEGMENDILGDVKLQQDIVDQISFSRVIPKSEAGDEASEEEIEF